MGCFVVAKSVRRAAISLMATVACCSTNFGQGRIHSVQSYIVTVEVNSTQSAVISVPRGQVVIIDYDIKVKTLVLSQIKQIDLHPSVCYVKKGSIFFTALQPGTFKLNGRGGAWKGRIAVK